MLRVTVDVKEQQQVADVIAQKVTQFKGLQSSSKLVRTVEVEDSLLTSKLVSGGSAYEEALKKQKEIQEQKKAKEALSTTSTQTLEAKNMFQQMEKDISSNNLKPSAAKRQKKKKNLANSATNVNPNSNTNDAPDEQKTQ
ncbi:hypothetical protein RFI_16674 [Reticulomyxa filosa]|uniref:Uncharacterized protein n=1 Tax=Reticulomyxa filosa TaxID=46433 RepID=X6N3Q8_RETFI|nr:hypothetical protein RFI_16674 [Reticulomyxa filosa]|eukprot:ETO20548.1 hypothetical protein RFI_16674 [Reticulomyxa filosa]